LIRVKSYRTGFPFMFLRQDAPATPCWFGLSATGQGVLLALLAPVLWSTSGLFVKILPLEALTLAGLRALIAGLVLAPFLRPRYLRPSFALLAVLLSYAVSVTAFVASVKLTTAANSIALVSTAPAWVLLLTWIAARRVQWPQAAPVALVLVGVAIMLSEPGTGSSLRGNQFALLAGLGFGVFTFFLTRVHMPTPALIALSNLSAAALVFAIVPSAWALAEISWVSWLALAYLGSVQIALATWCFGAALRRIPAMRASVLALLEPLLSPLWVFLAIGETPSLYGFTGGVCILGGILADFWTRRLSVRPREASLSGG
jgi:drug/metabolite transporter (DMT)-like permease